MSTKSAHLTRTVATAPAAPRNETAAKRDVSKLLKAIVDGLEDVKAQNLMVFDTEHLSSLFERVIVASGTSNRQTKALAMSVRDAVKEAGLPKPRIEGEDNGEWIIVDCGACVVHIMQPAIRQYYHLEDIWGEKPVRMKHAAPQKEEEKKVYATIVKEKKPAAGKKSASSATKKVAPAVAKTVPSDAKPAAKKAPAKTAPAKKVAAKKSTAKPSPQAVAKKAAAKKTAAKKAPAKKSA
jgi:ribosome-associated protein